MSIFTDMIAGTIPAVTVVEDEQHIAFMEPNPNSRGHVICLPKAEVHDLFAMDKADYDALMAFTRRVAAALQCVVPCRKVGMASIGLAVAHVHIHLVPLNEAKEMNFIDKVAVDVQDMHDIARQIQAAL